MEIILAKNAVLSNKNGRKPSVDMDAGEPHAKFIWTVHCFPRIVSKSIISDEVREQIVTTARYEIVNTAMYARSNYYR